MPEAQRPGTEVLGTREGDCSFSALLTGGCKVCGEE